MSWPWVCQFGGLCYRWCMNEPTLRNSRLALAGGLAIALSVGGTGFLIGRGTSPREDLPPAAAPVAAVPDVVQPAPSLPDSRDIVKTRADLIALASQASDALASGRPLPKAAADLAGQRFELRLPFGCRGPSDADSNSSMRWRYDAEAKALRVHVAPVIWRGADLGASEDGSATGTIAEGFWISRPWTASETCPAAQDSAAPTGTDAVTLPGQTLAVAQFADGAGQRLHDAKWCARPWRRCQALRACSSACAAGSVERRTDRPCRADNPPVPNSARSASSR